MCAVFAGETGMTLNDTSEMAVRLYALAAQIYGLYAQNQWTQNQCFPQTASGEYLDYHARLRGLIRNEAQCARGHLRFTIDEAQDAPLAIEKGTICMTAGLVRFETTEGAAILPGETQVDIPAKAAQLGPAGNVPAGSVRVLSVAPLGVSGCTNESPFTGGVETESDDALRGRILETYARIPNGANAAYYQREALGFSEVVAVNVLPRSRGRGTVDIVIAAADGTASETLLEEVQEHMDKRREIAVDLQVLPPQTVPLNLSVTITGKNPEAMPELIERVQKALVGYFDGRLLGCDVLRAKLGDVIFQIEGVTNYHILWPQEDLQVQPGQLPILESLTVEAMP